MAGKVHVKRKAGRKATKKKSKDVKKKELGSGSSVGGGGGAEAAVSGLKGMAGSGDKKQPKQAKKAGDPGANPRAFAFQSAVKAKAYQARSAEKAQRRLHAPLSERASDEPPPLLVLVHGPPQVGKTSLIKGLVKHYTKQNLNDPRGPITVVTGKKRRITLLECPPDLPGMMDAAKVADLVLLMIDGSFGLEMETFEFLNLLQVHGFPKVMGVLSHLDGFKEPSRLKKAKKALKARFWTEVYDGAKLFYLSGMQHGKYLKREVLNLARFISVTKTRPLTWRLDHPYLIADRFEDVTAAEPLRLNPKADRDLLLYGYLRGAPLRNGARLHLAGVGDFDLQEVDCLPDPCPLPGQDPGAPGGAAAAAGGSSSSGTAAATSRRRTLSDKERLIHAPMSDLGGMLFDRDAVYIDLPDWKVQYTSAAGAAAAAADPAAAAAAAAAAEAAGGYVQEGEAMVRGLQATRLAVDEKLSRSKIQLFSGGSSLQDIQELHSEDGSEDEEDDQELDSEDEEEEEDEELGSDSEDQQQQQQQRGLDKVNGGRGLGQLPSYEAVQHGGRVRRRAMFGSSNGAAAAAAAVFEGASEEEEEEQRYQQQWGNGKVHSGDDSEDGCEDDREDADGMGAAAAWKDRIQERVASLFATRGADLSGFIYNTRATSSLQGLESGSSQQQQQQQQLDEDQEDEGEEDDDFFRLKVPGGKPAAAAAAVVHGGGRQQQQQEGPAAVLLQSADAFDSSRPFAVAAAAVILGSSSSSVPQGPGFSLLDLDARWSNPDAVQGLRNRFVTGDWDAAAARSKALPGEESDDDGEAEEGDVFGDFEDVEAGLTFTGDDAITAAAQKAIKDATAEELRAKKIAKRAAWDAGFAQGGGTAAAAAAAAVDRGVDPAAAAGSDDEDAEDGEDGAPGRPKNPNRRAEAEGESFYDAQKREMAARSAATAAALSQLDPKTRLALAGHGVGSYVRIRLTGVPYELVTHWDPHRPLLVGGLGQGEQRMGVMRLRFKRHRWYPKTLKARDPLVLSVGWRRFQSIPVYALEDHNRRLRALKYTPQHCHCLAAVYGPLAPPNTGVVAIQASAAGPTPPASWRIAGTAVVLEQEAELRVVKKLKLVGTPLKVHKHSAFVGGMFNSQLEASRFEGAAVQTVSGIRGTVKKALRAGVQGVPDGGVRVTFEDKPLLSDLVFLRAWVAVDIPQLHNTMTNLLAPVVAPTNASTVSRKGHDRHQQQEEEQDGGYTAPAAAVVSSQAAAAAAAAVAGVEFSPAAAFAGSRAGFVFKKGPQGLGYYADVNPKGLNPPAAASLNPAAVSLNPAAGGAAAAAAAAGPAGWVGMRTVAELRREAGVGAPRDADSMYKHIERAPRVFNPLKVPAKLQAALPFKTKPKVEAPRKRKTLEHKRAVVLDKDEKKAATLLQQLNAIRNAKAEKRHQQSTRRREQYAKKQAKEAEWRDKHNKDERKQRHVAAGKAAKRAAMASEGGGGKFAAMAAKKQRRQEKE